MDSLLAPPYPQEDHLASHYDNAPSYDSSDYHTDPAHFPRTPSYNGSYQNSPYSSYSDLPPIDSADRDFGPFNGDNPSVISITEEYDPSEYDVPSSLYRDNISSTISIESG